MFTQRLKRRLCRFVAFGLAAWALPLAFARAESSVVIGEVSWAGSSVSSADEWVELWNLGTEPVQLDGYRLMGAGGTNGITFGSDDVILDGEAFLIANDKSSDTKTVLNISPLLVTSTLSLPNDKLGLQLVDKNSAILDKAGGGSAPPAGSSGITKTTMIRGTPIGDGSLKASWVSATTAQNIKSGYTDLGTPGVCDGCSKSPENVPATEAPPPAPLPATTQTSTECSQTSSTASPTVSGSTSSSTPNLTATTALAPEPTETPSSTAIVTEPLVASTTGLELPAAPTMASIETTNVTTTETSTPAVPLSTGDVVSTGGSSPSIVTVTQAKATKHKSKTKQPSKKSVPIKKGPHIAKILAHPKKGSAWIELAGVKKSELASLEGMSIRDLEGNLLARMTKAQLKKLSSASSRMRIPIAKKYLPKAGGAVRLVSKDEETLDEIEYPELKAGEVWHRPTAKSAKKTEKKSIVKKETKKSRAKAAPKSPATKQTKTFTPDKPVRVTMKGTVASVPGLLAKNQFILQTADGRGLLILGNGKQISPNLGAHVQVSGTLVVNDDGAGLKMSARDLWLPIESNATVSPRTVNLLSPSKEDAWSFVNVTGTVRISNHELVRLDTADASFTLQVKPILGYRAERLLPGDVIQVSGLLDTRNAEPKVIPRASEEIVVVSHRKTAKMPAQKNSVPPWAPVGSAGASVAVVEGAKYLQRIREQKRLAKMLADAGKALTQ